jgi:hypothetical protein
VPSTRGQRAFTPAVFALIVVAETAVAQCEIAQFDADAPSLPATQGVAFEGDLLLAGDRLDDERDEVIDFDDLLRILDARGPCP